MLTAAITAAIVAVLKIFGITLGVAAIGGIAIAVKIIIVGVLSLLGYRLVKKEKAKKAAEEAAAAARIRTDDV